MATKKSNRKKRARQPLLDYRFRVEVYSPGKGVTDLNLSDLYCETRSSVGGTIVDIVLQAGHLVGRKTLSDIVKPFGKLGVALLDKDGNVKRRYIASFTHTVSLPFDLLATSGAVTKETLILENAQIEQLSD